MSDSTSHNVQRLADAHFASRLFSKDASLWGEDSAAEAAIRLNWVDAPRHAEAVLADARTLRERFQALGVDRFVLCGMGGSSLGPDMLARCSGVSLHVLDTTHPSEVLTAASDLATLGVIISSKSGTTLETRSHLALFESRFREANIDPVSRIVIITDPGTELEEYAREFGYALVLADPDVGGRFSIFTAFGLVPPELAGASLEVIVASALESIDSLSRDAVANPALILAAEAFRQQKSFQLEIDQPYPGLADWVEQLVAESTGKGGRGVLPTLRRSTGGGDGHSRPEPGLPELGELLMTWQVATAALGYLLGVNPFDQPDVEQSKQATRSLLTRKRSADKRTSDISQSWALLPIDDISRDSFVHQLRKQLTTREYVALQLFAPYESAARAFALREWLAETLRVPVTVGWGPRFLHSTGQLHKGGPRTGVFVQVVAPFELDCEIPGQHFTFGELLRAQANGDATVLAETGQPVLRIEATVDGLCDALDVEAAS